MPESEVLLLCNRQSPEEDEIYENAKADMLETLDRQTSLENKN